MTVHDPDLHKRSRTYKVVQSGSQPGRTMVPDNLIVYTICW